MVKGPPPKPSRWPRRLTQTVLGLAAAALVIGGVIAAGRIARDSLGPRDRYALPFGDIECDAPPGQDRADFLGEVQYNGAFPDALNVLARPLIFAVYGPAAIHGVIDARSGYQLAMSATY